MINNKPVFDIKLEQHVFGASILMPEFYYMIADLISEDDFYDIDFNTCFKYVREKYDNGQVPNQVELYKYVRDNNLDQDKILTAINDSTSLSELAQNYAYKMKEYSYLRRLSNLAMRIGKSANDKSADCFDIMTEIQEELTQMELGIKSSNIEHIKDIGMAGLKSIYDNVAKKSVKPIAIPTFSHVLNQMSGGFINGGLSIIGGLAGGGKTAFALQCMLHQIELGHKVGFVSLEMSKDHIYKRMMSNMARVDGYAIRDGLLDTDSLKRLNKSTEQIIKKQLFISDDPYTTQKKLRPIVRQFVKKHGCEIVYIDYFQLIGKDQKTFNSAEANEQLTQHMQKIAREFNIPLVCISQLNRSEGRPNMNSLRGGGIEFATDLIIMLYDPEYNSKEDIQRVNSTQVDMTAIVVKCKHGSVGDVPIHYNKSIQTIEDGHVGAPVDFSTKRTYTSFEDLPDDVSTLPF